MKQTTQSILLATLLLASGFASAQSSTVPATRADVKSEIGSTERRAGTGELIKPNKSDTIKGNTSGVTRTEVKSEAGMTERKASTGEAIKPNASDSAATQGNTSGTTRTEVKAVARTEPRRLSTGEVAKSGSTSASTAENKRLRDERRAKAKAKRDGAMKTGSTSPAPVSGIAR